MDNPVAIVTGAASGIGLATANRFVGDGYFVVAVDVTPPDVGRAAAAFPDRAESRICDISREAQVRELIEYVDGRHGRLDALLNVAGVVLVKPLEDTSWEEFERVVAVNLGGTFLLCKYSIPVMKRQGHGVIVNMASVSGHVGQVNHALYGATKGGIIALTKALAWELAPYGIRVNSVSPGSVDTPMLRGDIAIEAARTGQTEERIRELREQEQALGRWADPIEIAGAISFFVGQDASFITGTDLLVDAGWVAR